MRHLLPVYVLLVSLTAVATCLSLRQQPRHSPHQQTKDADAFNLVVEDFGAYTVFIRGKRWLYSSTNPAFFNVDGLRFRALDTLSLNTTTKHSGSDQYGTYNAIVYHYFADSAKFEASIRLYEGQSFAIFSQTYVTGAKATRADNVNYAISGFPSFLVSTITSASNMTVGYLAYGGMMCGDTDKKMGVFSEDKFRITSGLAGGPVAILDGNNDTLILSPASNFMAASDWLERVPNADWPDLHFGIMGGVEEVPAGTSVDFIVYFSSEGINKAFEGWGSVLRKAHGRKDDIRNNDLTINYLGYWTDNGAYYYYMTEQNQTYEQTMFDAKAYSDNVGLPFKYWQYDSWWYYKGVGSGVKTWVSRPDIFPDGFEYVSQKIGLPASAHNRYWSSDTSYAKQNGGAYNFIVEPVISVPDDQKFWDDLFANSSRWGLYTYEQDWLNREFSGSMALLSDVQLGSRWLNQMAAGAAKNNMTIQYCMSNSRHVMHALTTNAVTQARASDDYSPGDDQWKIGISSMFANAMGIAPFKDNFWSTTNQPYNPYNRTEPHNELELTVSVLSTGPVGPSDMIGHANVTLIKRCCNADGLILKPSKPATAIDDIIYREATGRSIGEVWSTYSQVSDLLFGIIFVPEISATLTYTVTPAMAGFSQTTKPLMVFEAHDVTQIAQFSADNGLTVSTSCSRSYPCMYHVTPVLKTNPTVLLLGEMDKIVPVSPQRVTAIDVTGDDVTLHVQGVAKERVNFTFSVDSQPVLVTCEFGESKTAVLSLNSKSCK